MTPSPSLVSAPTAESATGDDDYGNDDDNAAVSSPLSLPPQQQILETTLRLVDPLLQFLTKATGRTSVPLPTLNRVVPRSDPGTAEDPSAPSNKPETSSEEKVLSVKSIQSLVDIGILHLYDVSADDRSNTNTSGSNQNRSLSRAAITGWDDTHCEIGFPPPISSSGSSSSSSSTSTPRTTTMPKKSSPEYSSLSLHGSTKTAAKRRMAALKRYFSPNKHRQKHGDHRSSSPAENTDACDERGGKEDNEATKTNALVDGDCEATVGANTALLSDERRARDAFCQLLFRSDHTSSIATSISSHANMISSNKRRRSEEPPRDKDDNDSSVIPTRILPKQLSYAGSNPAQPSVYGELSPETLQRIPMQLRDAFNLSQANAMDVDEGCTSPKRATGKNSKRLYRHQAAAIEAAMNWTHCTVCTGTGSGKSLCFLLPVLTEAYNNDRVSIILYPTKALAQDQLSKLTAILSCYPELSDRIRPATLDGDCPHSRRALVAEAANVVMTNPDTLHAAILPNWKRLYRKLLSRASYVVIDEAHMYEGTFGAHVAMILSRLARVCYVAAASSKDDISRYHQCRHNGILTFMLTSATLPWPESHFRQLCPVAADAPVVVLSSEQDGSPRSWKHFFVWNPPILNADGTLTGEVTSTHLCSSREQRSAPDKDCPSYAQKEVLSGRKRRLEETATAAASPDDSNVKLGSSTTEALPAHPTISLHRRHAAEETALLLARAVSMNVRCIAFCKTRNLVEWVYDRALSALKSDPNTAHLSAKIESYRGGYSSSERRRIERLLFRNELLGVVGTNALELGVDIGGVDLTLHCGYPSSHASLLQQAGRAGRGVERLAVPSCAVVVCFNSPSEQHMWRHPQSLFGKGALSTLSISLAGGLVQGHMACASLEFPLTGNLPIAAVFEVEHFHGEVPSDRDLFGGGQFYDEALESLKSFGSVTEESLPGTAPLVKLYKGHCSVKNAWSQISIRSIEPVNYSLIDTSHPGQGGRMDCIHDEKAIMDTLPYSRVFLDAHPGAIITHRGNKYKIISMTRPPEFMPENFGYRRSVCLAAYAKLSKGQYFTRPLSNLKITIVKAMEVATENVASSVAPKNVDTAVPETRDNEECSPSVPVCTLAGCGAVSVKRTVHGYKKLSLITKAELSRSELSLPPIEYDSFGIWIDTEADILSPLLGEKYGPGVHALSHAILAVAPLFAPGVVRSDLECDHSAFETRRVMLFDERAGGSGACKILWSLFFRDNGILASAIQMLEECSTCTTEQGYDGGCPACLHAPNCLKFNMHISRSAAVIIGKRMLNRIKCTELFRRNDVNYWESMSGQSDTKVSTPRRQSRAKALQTSKDMHLSKERQFVIGRASWPTSNEYTANH